ncbi:hypothetical protein H6G52_12100 [Limnothrix sp. FACHB-881]|uniref:hypothetical protein n=1 Tax=Limnothrix sp. FACHB-881 TaxID=2692819 RepID=UPI0016860AB1|nr:hypothetical protein [Limnothrix sp. FACHB-881]MBD2636104.1 hypothetical protein [Limnothrix sp. FACHB-881]
MKTYIVCQGRTEVQLLKKVLPLESTKNVEIVEGGGLYALKSLALSLIVRRQSPVVVVVDSDSVVPEQVQQRVRDIEELLSSLAANTPVKVIPAIPALESIFFYDVPLLTHLLDYAPTPDLLSQATYQPRKVLDQLIFQSKDIKNIAQLMDNLTEQDVATLRESRVIQELMEFLQSVQVTDEVLERSP